MRGGYASDDYAGGAYGRDYELYDEHTARSGYDSSSSDSYESESRRYSKSDDSHGHGYGTIQL